MAISLLTHGWICYRKIVKRFYILPMNLIIKSQQLLDLFIKIQTKLNLNINQIVDKNINLKLTDKNINIKKESIINIGVKPCSQA